MEFNGSLNPSGPRNRRIYRIDISCGAGGYTAREFDKRLSRCVLSHAVKHRRTVRGIAEYLVKLAVRNCLHGLRLYLRKSRGSRFGNRKDGFVPRGVTGRLVEFLK